MEIPPDTRATRRQWLAVAGVLIGAFMAILDITITNASMQNIQGGLNATLDEGAWISTGYLIAEIIVIPLTGWLSQIFSLKRYIVWSAVAFLISSILCGLSWNLSSMIVFRFIQGASGGVLIPLCVTIVMSNLPKSQQPLGLTLFGTAVTLAPAIGPVVGGWLTVNFSWPLIFYVNVLPGLALIFLLSKYLVATPMHLDKLKDGDYKGIALITVFLGSLTVVLEEGPRRDWMGDDLLRFLTIAALISVVWFFIHEAKTEKPFINLRLLKRRNFALSTISGAIFGMGSYGSIFLIPFFLARVRNLDALQIGQVIMWMGLPQLLVIPFVPSLMKRFDIRLLGAIGFFIFGTSILMNSNLTHDWGYDQFFWSQIVRAVGQPLIITPVSSLAYVGMELSEMGSASGLFNMMRNLGGSVGIGVLGTMLTNRYVLHFTRISESVSRLSFPVQEQLGQRTAYLSGHGVLGGVKQSVLSMYGTFNREAIVMSFSDCFLFVGIMFYLCALMFFLMKKPTGAPQARGADH